MGEHRIVSSFRRVGRTHPSCRSKQLYGDIVAHQSDGFQRNVWRGAEILRAQMVTREGLPVSYDVCPVATCEGRVWQRTAQR